MFGGKRGKGSGALLAILLINLFCRIIVTTNGSFSNSGFGKVVPGGWELTGTNYLLGGNGFVDESHVVTSSSECGK